MSTTAAVCAGWATLSFVVAGCFGEAPTTDETTMGSTTSSGSTDAMTSTTDPTATTTTVGTVTSVGTDTETTTVDPTLADSSSTTTSSESSSAGTETEGEAPTFFDDFERDNSQLLGNDWVEKLPSVFSIDEGVVAAESNDLQDYFDQVVHQQDNVVADIELRVEFRIDSMDELNEPHLVARQQEDALTEGQHNHCYILVPQLSLDRLALMRFDSLDAIGDVQWTDWPNADLVAGEWYRLVMTIEGAAPVMMTGRLERSTNEGWIEVVAVGWVDNTPNQIVAPGVWGFSGGTTGTFYNNFVFDNFSAYYR